MNAILSRLKEPSTYAGLSVLLGLAGVHLAPEQASAIISAATAAAGLASVFIPERGNAS
jgi:hypothetical protein